MAAPAQAVMDGRCLPETTKAAETAAFVCRFSIDKEIWSG